MASKEAREAYAGTLVDLILVELLLDLDESDLGGMGLLGRGTVPGEVIDVG